MSKRRRRSSKSPVPTGDQLPTAELEILAYLWRRGKATAREVREAMAGYRPMAHGSMVTLLRRLEAKGWVTREKGPVGKAFIYEPTQGPSPTYRRIVHKLVRRIFGGNGVAMVSSLFATKPPTESELERLQQLLDELQAKTKRGKKK